jgi:polyisoprenyl-phosphate glycosyltransferase
MNKKTLTIVIPCFNEEETLKHSYAVISDLCRHWVESGLLADYELFFVNDGSRDKSLEILKNIYNKDNHVNFLDLRKNVGFQGAITAGMFESAGDMVVTIDADLQDDPKKIEEMINKHYEGFDMVLGVRQNRDSDTFFKRFFAQSYYNILSRVGVASVYNHADFRLMSRQVVKELQKFPERVRYLRSLIFEVEPNYVCVYYERVSRKFGKSKFTFSKSLSLAIDGITSFTSRPIRFLSVLGIVMFCISVLGGILVLFDKLYWHLGLPGWASLTVIILFFGGIQNLSIGMVGEYVAKIYTENKQRPLYLVRNIYKHDKK